MVKDLDDKLKKLEEKKKKILLKEKILREKEKKKKSKRFSLIGKLASKANIDHFDDKTLLGAFLEIQRLSESEEIKSEWKSSGQSFIQGNQITEQTPLSLSFTEDPDSLTKKALKDLGFRWNSFRKEFYGYGKKEELQSVLNGTKFNIEVLS